MPRQHVYNLGLRDMTQLKARSRESSTRDGSEQLFQRSQHLSTLQSLRQSRPMQQKPALISTGSPSFLEPFRSSSVKLLVTVYQHSSLYTMSHRRSTPLATWLDSLTRHWMQPTSRSRRSTSVICTLKEYANVQIHPGHPPFTWYRNQMVAAARNVG